MSRSHNWSNLRFNTTHLPRRTPLSRSPSPRNTPYVDERSRSPSPGRSPSPRRSPSTRRIPYVGPLLRFPYLGSRSRSRSSSSGPIYDSRSPSRSRSPPTESYDSRSPSRSPTEEDDFESLEDAETRESHLGRLILERGIIFPYRTEIKNIGLTFFQTERVIIIYIKELENLIKEGDQEKISVFENDFKTTIAPVINKLMGPIIIDIFLNENFSNFETEDMKLQIETAILYYFSDPNRELKEKILDVVKNSLEKLIDWLLIEWKNFKTYYLKTVHQDERLLLTKRGKKYNATEYVDAKEYSILLTTCVAEDCYMFAYPESNIILCYDRKEIKEFIKDFLSSWRYWCVEDKLVNSGHPNDRVKKVRENTGTYVNLPISPSEETILVPLWQLFSILHNNNRIVYPKLHGTGRYIDATSNFENMYILLEESVVSSNYCQNGTDAYLYNLTICEGDNCHNFGKYGIKVEPLRLRSYTEIF